MKREIIIATFSVCLCVFSFTVGYEYGFFAGAEAVTEVAIDAIDEIPAKAVATNDELIEAIADQIWETSREIVKTSDAKACSLPPKITTGTSDLVTTCAVIHADGRQCVSDGHGGFLPHD